MTAAELRRRPAASELSVVVPAFDEGRGIATFPQPLVRRPARPAVPTHEVWVIDDGSRDDTWQRLVAERAPLSGIAGGALHPQFRQGSGDSRRVAHARCGRAVVVMDADGQHPPSLLPQLLEPWRAGRRAAWLPRTKRRETSDASRRARVRALFNRLMRILTGLDLSAASDYRLLDRKVVDALLAFPEKVRFFRGMTVWTGFASEYVSFDVAPRIAGTSHWSGAQLAKLALTAISAYSAKPLGMILRLGFIGMAAAAVLLLQALYSWITGIAVSGWTSLTVVVLFFGSANLLALGVLGVYLAQLFDEIKARPEYLIGDELR